MEQGPKLAFLAAAHEMLRHVREVVPCLAMSAGVRDAELFYAWAEGRLAEAGRLRPRRRGPLGRGPWQYWFHGLECDVDNVRDGRRLRIDFGPGGRIDSFSPGSVADFVAYSRPPWGLHGALREHLFAAGERSSRERARNLADELLAEGLLQHADVELQRARAEQTGSTPRRPLALPQAAPAERLYDMMVCHRLRLTARGEELAAAHARAQPEQGEAAGPEAKRRGLLWRVLAAGRSSQRV
jgi:hypothetical protein